MRLAIVAAGFNPGEADQLRRSMAAWHKTGMIETHENDLFPDVCNGYTRAFAESYSIRSKVRRVWIFLRATLHFCLIGLRLGLAQTLLSSSILDCSIEQPAYGISTLPRS